mmetsp:Transcript_76222/g.217765  ORF Transcript_76222/g.217765 Transcript_76222/m.217765 type:complete len:281 (-) Transcript_76222:331-1173(-)
MVSAMSARVIAIRQKRPYLIARIRTLEVMVPWRWRSISSAQQHQQHAPWHAGQVPCRPLGPRGGLCYTGESALARSHALRMQPPGLARSKPLQRIASDTADGHLRGYTQKQGAGLRSQSGALPHQSQFGEELLFLLLECPLSLLDLRGHAQLEHGHHISAGVLQLSLDTRPHIHHQNRCHLLEQPLDIWDGLAVLPRLGLRTAREEFAEERRAVCVGLEHHFEIVDDSRSVSKLPKELLRLLDAEHFHDPVEPIVALALLSYLRRHILNEGRARGLRHVV